MPYTDEHTGLEVVPLATCVRLLESNETGRIAFISRNEITLYPINYMWDGEGIVFRCEADSRLAGATGTEVVFETDGVQSRDKSGWSVIARGVPQLVDPQETPELARRLRGLALFPYAGGEKESWLRLIPAPLTGRQISKS